MISRLKGPSDQPAAIENWQLASAGDEINLSLKDNRLIISIFTGSGQGQPEAAPKGQGLDRNGKI
jgi:hypothetical protein